MTRVTSAARAKVVALASLADALGSSVLAARADEPGSGRVSGARTL
jgi:hypothetical protein